MAKKRDGKWWVDIRPEGRNGARVRKSFPTLGEANQYELHILSRAKSGQEWRKPVRDTRRMTALVEKWYELHGVHLKDGHRRRDKMLLLCKLMGNPFASSFDSAMFLAMRKQRLDQGLTHNTVNHDLSYLLALFNELIRAGEYTGSNPLKNIRKLKVDETELTFLSPAQVDELLAELHASRNPGVCVIAKICLATGARWGEAEGLRREQLRNGLITYARTKSGRNRSIPISKTLEREILHGRSKIGPLFQPAWEAFRCAVERINLQLPDGQMTHVLRHTFASHFMGNGGNILVLQRILGHSTVAMTQRYAHLAPDHMRAVLENNPLSPRRGQNVDKKPKLRLVKAGRGKPRHPHN